MKPKKLALNKTTVANLNTSEMRWVYGGKEPASGDSCPVCVNTYTCPETWDCPITSTVTFHTCAPCAVPNDPPVG